MNRDRVMATQRQSLPAARFARRLLALLVAAACLPAMRSHPDEPTKTEKPPTDSMHGKEAGEARDDNTLKMKLVWCPPGFLKMRPFAVRRGTLTQDGTVFQLPNEVVELPAVEVVLTRGYWLGKCEVTQAEWKRLTGAEPWKRPPASVQDGAELPATCISCEEAAEFCEALTQQERKAGRLPDDWEYALPTEAEWERACRAGTETTFSFGDDASELGDYAWFDANTGRLKNNPQPVGRKKPNAWGLHDMHGNVAEWCRDYYSQQLPGGRNPETIQPDVNKTRVVRGGWYYSGTTGCRPTSRHVAPTRFWNEQFGFRVALTQVRPEK